MIEMLHESTMLGGTKIIVAAYNDEDDLNNILCSIGNWESLIDPKSIVTCNTSASMSEVCKAIVDEAIEKGRGRVLFKIRILGKMAIAHFSFAELNSTKDRDIAYRMAVIAVTKSLLGVSRNTEVRMLVRNMETEALALHPF